MTSPTLAPVFAALGDETRWQILVRLGEGPASASTLGREFPVSRQAIVRHIEVLRGAGLIESTQVGREVVHRALGGRLSDLARQLEKLGKAWDVRLAKLKDVAERKD